MKQDYPCWKELVLEKTNHGYYKSQGMKQNLPVSLKISKRYMEQYIERPN